MEQQLPISRVPPSHTEAERSLLGAMLLSPKAVMLAQETITEEDFYDPVNREVYAAMSRLTANMKPVDIVTVNEELARHGKLEGVGGLEYLLTLSRSVPTSANAAAYLRIVDEKSTLRKLIAASEEIERECYAGEEDMQELLAKAEKRIYDISMKKGGEMLQQVRPVVMSTYHKIEDLARNKGKLEGLSTGYTKLDNMLTGLHPGEFILIGARPSMGKTSLAMNIVGNAAIRGHAKVAVFSLEMPAEQLIMRMLCTEARVDMQKVRQGNMDENEWSKISDVMGDVSVAGIYIDATAGIGVPEMRSKARRMQMEHGLDLVVIDYLQLMSATGRFGSRQEEVSNISRGLKSMAQELQVPVVCASQLSRAAAGRSDHRPVLSDIRDSGAIEQDADVVMFVHREKYYNPETEKGDMAEIIIAKQRNGPLGTVELMWVPEFTLFKEIPNVTKGE